MYVYIYIHIRYALVTGVSKENFKTHNFSVKSSSLEEISMVPCGIFFNLSNMMDIVNTSGHGSSTNLLILP